MDDIIGFDFIKSQLYIVYKVDGDSVYLDVLSFAQGFDNDSELNFRVQLDRKLHSDDLNVSYDAGNDLTTITLPYDLNGSTPVIVTDGGSEDIEPGFLPEIKTASGTTITVQSDISSWPFFVGVPYESEYQLSTVYLRERGQGGSTTVTTGTLKLQNLKFKYDNSGFFTISVSPEGRKTYEYSFNGRQVSGAGNVIGATAISSGAFQVPIFSQNDRVTVSIKSDSHLPFFIQSVDWVGQYTQHSRRT
jgi:hypothetical protein